MTAHDRKISKKNVALSKADQRQKMAVKAFQKHQQNISKELRNMAKIKKAIDAKLAENEEERVLEQRFLGQITKQFKSLEDLQSYLKASQKAHQNAVADQKQYVSIVKDAGKAPKINTIKTMGDLSILLAIGIVLLKRLLSLKPAK